MVFNKVHFPLWNNNWPKYVQSPLINAVVLLSPNCPKIFIKMSPILLGYSSHKPYHLVWS